MNVHNPAPVQAAPDLHPALHGVIAVSGADAANFLQGQLTNDIRTLIPESVLRAAYQTPQGRVIALLRVVATHDGCLLLLPRGLAAAVAARLARYTLRAKVRVADVSDQYDIAALTARAYPEVCASLGISAHPGQTHVHTGSRHIVDCGAGRTLVLSAHGEPSTVAGTTDDQAWLLAGVVAGDPEVWPQTTESFTAHMLNVDLIGGVSFTKGCYTGQEIVARTQHLGRVKRRLFRYRCDGAAPPPLTALHYGDTKVGEIATSASCEADSQCLAVVSLDARNLTLKTPAGIELHPAPLPYAVP